MTEAREAIHGILVADTDVTSIVGSDVYAVYVPQSKNPPYIVFRTLRTTPIMTDDGPSNLDTPLIQLLCYHDEAEDAEDLAKKAKTALDRYTGTISNQRVQRIFFNDEENGWDPSIEKPYVEQLYKLKIAV